jgi:predicted benzoate:H+ symporter BenE
MQRLVPPLSMAIPLSIIAVAVMTIPLATAQALELTPQQTGAWLFALYAIPGLLSLLLTHLYRQPLFLGWNVAVIVFLASLAGQVRYTDLLGAALVGGAVVALLVATSTPAAQVLTLRGSPWYPQGHPCRSQSRCDSQSCLQVGETTQVSGIELTVDA